MANRLTDAEIETPCETVSQIYAEVVCKKLAYGLRKVSVKRANKTLGEISTDLGRDTW